jgi:hypothetical protein
MYTDTLGEWARITFLVGAIAVLASTLWAAVPSWARMYVNVLATLRLVDWHRPATRRRWIRVFTVVLPLVWGAAYLLVSSPVIMVQIGGVMTGIFLLAVVVAVWYLRHREVDPRLYGGRAFTLVLLVSSVAIGLLGLYTLANVFGFTIG